MDFALKVAAKRISDEVKNGSNAVVSPMSIAIVLNMVASGSDGETLDQFFHFLGAKETSQLTSNSQELISHLTSEEDDITAQLQQLGLVSDDPTPPPQPPSPSHASTSRAILPRRSYSSDTMQIYHAPPPCPTCGNSAPPPPPSSNFAMIMWFPPHMPPLPPHYSPMRPLLPFLPLPWAPYDYEASQNHVNEEPKGSKKTVFLMANALWLDHASPLKPSFAEFSDSVYKALVKNADFVNEEEKMKEETNSWAEKETKGLIKDLTSPINHQQILSPPLSLSAAICFKGAWQHPFNASNTQYGCFHLLDGRITRLVPFMTSRFEHHRYESYDDFKILELPYWHHESDESQLSMYIFLPHQKDGIKDLVAKLNADPSALHPLKYHLENEEVELVSIPKMRLSHVFDAREAAVEKGLTLPFDIENADFSNMAEGGGKVCIGSMVHKASVIVDEEGTEGPAARHCAWLSRSQPFKRRNLTFVADHPFLFMIVEGTSQPLFVGAVLDPHLE